MDLLIGLLSNLAYENVRDGVEVSEVDVFNIILTYVYDHARDFDKPVFAPTIKLLAVFYFLAEENAKIDF